MPRRLATAAALALLAACATGGLRPRLTPFPDAPQLIVERPAATLIGDLETAVRHAGLSVARSVPREGYLETRWFDVTTRQAVSPPYAHLDRVVRLRFFADPYQGKTRLVGECVQRYLVDPSLPERDLERTVPATHPGRVLLDSLMAPLAPDTTRRAGPPLRSG